MGFHSVDMIFIMKKQGVFLMALLMMFLAGCATLRGIAEDTQNLGRGLKKTLSEEDGESRRQTR